MSVNPEMVRLAREARGMTQKRLAEASTLGQGTISKIESGLLEAPQHVITAIARGMQMPESFFYQDDVVHGAGTNEFFHRKRQSVPSTVLTRVHAQINIQRMHVSRLLRSVDLPACRIPVLDLSEFRGIPAEVARAVRSTLNVAPGPIPNMVGLIEDSGGVVIPCDFGTYDVDAISRWVPGLPPLFFANHAAPVDRLRMSLAHELGHMVMHRVPEQDMEPQANQFAAEFLMPAAQIKQQLYGLKLDRLAALKPHWRVSMAALLVRATDLGTVSTEAARYLWMHISKRGYRKREPAELDLSPEEPTLIREMLEFHRKSLGYSLKDLSHTLAATEDDLIATYGLAPDTTESVRALRRVK